MSEKQTVLTYTGLKELEEELRVSKTIKRKDIAEKIKEARGQGDLSENAEYDSAKEDQAKLEARIVALEKMLRNAVVIDEEDLNHDVISIGSTVTLFDVEYNEQVKYSIVGSAEANPGMGKISNESPLGSVLLGHKKGDVVEVDAPVGIVKYNVVEIE